LAATLAGIGAPSAYAATRPTTYWLYLGCGCANARSSDRAQVHFVWRNSKGAVKLDLRFRTSKGGDWPEIGLAAPKVLRIGDVLKATVGGTTHKLRIPTLRIKLDADTDTFHGRAPANSSILLGYADGLNEIAVGVGSDGRWRYNDPAFDIQSGTHAYARWNSVKGDTVTFENSAP
jgi:hypothetical protein